MPIPRFIKGIYADAPREASRYQLYFHMSTGSAVAAREGLMPAGREQEMLYDVLSNQFRPLYEFDDEGEAAYEQLSFAVDDCVDQIKLIGTEYNDYKLEGLIADDFVASEIRALRELLVSLKAKIDRTSEPLPELLQKAVAIKAYALNTRLVLLHTLDEMRGQIGDGVYPALLTMASGVLSVLDNELMSPGVSLSKDSPLNRIEQNYHRFLEDLTASQDGFLASDDSHMIYQYWKRLIDTHFDGRVDIEAFQSPGLAETRL